METQEVQLKQEAVELKQSVISLVVKNQEQYNEASSLLLKVQERKKLINAWFDPLVKAAHAAHKTLKDRQNETLAPAVEAESKIKYEMQNYIMEQDRIQAEAQRKLDDDAARKRKELEEKARIAAEQGKENRAEKLREKAEATVAPIVAPSVQTTTRTESGVTSIKRHTEVTITNVNVLIQQIAAGVVPSTVCEISESKLVKWIDAADIKTVLGLAIRFNVPGLAGRQK